MYSNFLFLLIVFLIPNLADDNDLITSPKLAFILGILLYALTLLTIVFQKNRMRFLVNIELISFLVAYFFILDANRMILEYIPFQFVSTLIALVYYFFGLYLSKNAFKEMSFLIPFVIPLLLFSLIPEQNILTIFALVCFFLIYFPYFIQKIWACKPLKDYDPQLAEQLESLCKKAKFKHAGILTWTVMNESMTAAIIGIIPQIRYVMFTKKLIKTVSPNALSAILAHEIGHSQRKHLVIYQFILLGLILCLTLFELHLGSSLSPFLFFIAYLLIVTIYFRFVFGFFSRLFERQADLHVYELNLNPEYMIEALDDVAKASGNTYLVPCWHHYSIQERIDFLKRTMENSNLIKKHHIQVKKWLYFYFFILIVLSLLALYEV